MGNSKQFGRWSDAPVGTLVETRMVVSGTAQGPLLCGTRSDVDGKAGVLVLEANEKPPPGGLFSAGEIGESEALDISDRFRVEH
ncbi:MAG: hypothetical protein ACREEA_03730 [Stellaceae bacterium]